MAESFFATLACELLDRRSLPTPRDALLVVFEYLKGGYNRHRRQSSLRYLSPAAFEAMGRDDVPLVLLPLAAARRVSVGPKVWRRSKPGPEITSRKRFTGPGQLQRGVKLRLIGQSRNDLGLT